MWRREVWWTFALAGLPAFVMGIAVHYEIGYVDAGHLAPPMVAAALYAVSLGPLWPFLCSRPPAPADGAPAGA